MANGLCIHLYACSAAGNGFNGDEAEKLMALMPKSSMCVLIHGMVSLAHRRPESPPQWDLPARRAHSLYLAACLLELQRRDVNPEWFMVVATASGTGFDKARIPSD